MRILSGPIPGQSLTKKPGNYPWDKPSKFNNVDEIIELHLDDLSEEDSIDNLLLILERGLPLNVLVETYLTSKVSEGMHSIDVSILVAPVLHEFLYNLAKDSEEEQDSGFELLEGMATTLKDQVEESPAKQEEETKPSKGLMSRST